MRPRAGSLNEGTEPGIQKMRQCTGKSVRQGRTEMWRTGTQILRVTEKQRSEVG